MLISNIKRTDNTICAAPCQTTAQPLSRVNFRGGVNLDVVEPLYSKAMSKLKTFSVEEYKTLTEQEKVRLREEYYRNSSFISLPDGNFDMKLAKTVNRNEPVENFHEFFTSAIKETLDEKYGRGKYALICIGRSLSSVGKVLGYKIGEENVKNIPLSNAKIYQNKEYIDCLRQNGTIGRFNAFLESIGLKKEEIEKSDKTYIITDYCVTGKSLRGAKHLLTQEDVLGSQNVVAEDIMNCLTDPKLKHHAENYFFGATFKKLSFVNYATSINNSKLHVVDPQEQDGPIKLMWFKLLDNEMLRQGNETFRDKIIKMVS